MNEPTSRRKLSIYEFGPFRLEVDERRLIRNGQVIPLTTKVFDLLVLLVRSSGHLVRKELLIEELWADAFVEPGNLPVAVATLRRALEDHESYIETIPKQGYRFSGQVRDVTFLNNGSRTGYSPISDPNLITVLPLTIQGEGTELSSFAAATAKLITQALVHLPGLRTEDAEAVASYAVDGYTLDQLRSELRAKYALTGQMIKLKNATIVTVELIDIENTWHLWGERLMFHDVDLVELQAAIAKEISEKVMSEIARERSRSRLTRYTDDARAYQLYLKGRYFLSRFTVDGFKKSLEYFREIIATNTDYAPAHAGIADSYYGLCTTLLRPVEAMPRSLAAASTALSIDPEISEAHAALGMTRMAFEWNWQEAETEFRLATALDPSSVMCHFRYAALLLRLGRFDEARARIEQALALDPLSMPSSIYRGTISFFERKYEDAIELFQKSIEMDPYYHPARGRLAGALAQVGRFDEAVDEIKRARGIEDLPQFLGTLGYAYGRLGRRRDAKRILNRLSTLRQSRYVSPFFQSLIHVALGDVDLAFDRLEESVSERDEMLTYLLVSPELDPLRDDPRFTSLLRKVKLFDVYQQPSAA